VPDAVIAHASLQQQWPFSQLQALQDRLDDRTYLLVRDGNRELQPRIAVLQETRGPEKRPGEPRGFAGAAARQQRNERTVRLRTDACPCRRAVVLEIDFVSERMTDEVGVHSVIGEKLLFERQYAQYAIDGIANMRDARLAPGPHLRADVLNGRHAGRLDGTRDGQIEIG